MLLYHATIDRYVDSIRERIDLRKSKKLLDFGPGFYTTPEVSFAERTALSKARRNNLYPKNPRAKPVVIVFDCDIDSYQTEELRLFEFTEASTIWGDFIYNNRQPGDDSLIPPQGSTYSFHNRNGNYDIVYGPTADGRITELADRKLLYIDEDTVSDMKASIYGTQVSFHTQPALEHLRFVRAYIVQQREGDP